MAITISSLTPTNPQAIVGTSITFTVTASTTTANPLTYLWEFSSNGGASYTSAGLTNNTSSTYTTSNLTQSSNGLYFRVRISDGVDTIYSNEVPTIGNRIISVISNPQIIVLSDYDPSYTVSVGGTVSLQVTSTVGNIDLTNTANLANLQITWERSTNNGNSWTNVSQGISTQFVGLGTTPQTYALRSTLTLSNINFGDNLNRYRAQVTFPGASNTPVILDATIIYVSPSISIFKQPGASPDTQITNCYKTSIANSGNATFSVGALTTANTTLNYRWEFTVDNGTTWREISQGVTLFWFRLAAGTNDTSDTLQIQRLIYFETFGIRVTVSGTVGETSVRSNVHYIYMTDVQESFTGLADVNVVEDRYGNVVNRADLNFPTQTASISGSIDVARNTGLNGTKTFTVERKDPGTSTWYAVSDVITVDAPASTTYTATPATSPDPFDPFVVSYQTPPLRRDIDNGAQYRIKVTSTALFTLSGNTKVLTPYYSNVITLNVYRTSYILSDPSDALVYPGEDASFAVNATPSSGTTISYKWQYSINGSTWIDIPGSATSYTGISTSLLIYRNVPSTPTYFYYRVITSVPDQLSSSTSSAGFLSVRRDLFTSISIINDVYINQFQQTSFTVEAQSLSLRTITYQWQKSTNYNPNSPGSATWSNLTGQTTNTYTILSTNTTDTGYYRLRLTSAGGEVAFSNVAYLSVTALNITISQNIPTTRTFLEGLENEYTFSVTAVSSIGSEVFYQWQIRRPGDVNFSNFGVGYNGILSTDNSYTPNPFTRDESGSIIRCEITSTGIPTATYSNQCTITVNRRFSYFADAATKTISSGSTLVLDLNPTWTGGTPTYQWQRSTNGGGTWTNIAGETSSTYSIASVTTAINNYQYRCLINLTNCSQHEYSRAGTNFIVAATNSTPTVPITIVVSTAVVKPTYYTKQTEKTGAAIGTVICVAKPPGYVNNPSATTDDINQWQVAVSGSTTSAANSTSITTGTRPTWMSSAITYNVPKWVNDRYPGYLELRGQWLVKSEFPALYAAIGDAYGSTTTKFRLPNPYGKKLMGTGNVNNNSGSVSVIPLYGADSASGGDKNIPGSIGGVYNYSRSRQLPPGSPGISGEDDGTSTNTFALGNFNTTGFTESNNQLQPTFNGSFTYTVGPIGLGFLSSVPTHGHAAVTVGWENRRAVVDTNCFGGGFVSPQFPGTQADGGSIDIGPAGIANDQRGITHSHGVSINGTAPAANGNDNHGTGIGSGGGVAAASERVVMQVSTTEPTAGMFMEPAEITLTNQSRALFNSGLSFFLRNNETMPVAAPYFRLKYLIKAY